ncbi:MAG: 3-hydroxy-3-methylglutaryl-CoA reductase [Bacillota bacterium]|nr:3-hydroxy-3-methylglutaryl-CoA reductase [Bacillota bacterium]
MNEALRWPRRNDPASVLRRQAVLRGLEGWRDVGAREAVFRLPEERAGWDEAVECLTAQVAIPVSVVGPLEVELGEYGLDEGGRLREHARSRQRVWVPLAQTEGGLAASVQRGAIAVAAAGGIRTFVLEDRITRDTCFFFRTSADAIAFARWVEAEAPRMADWLQETAAGRSEASHLRLGQKPLVSRHALLREVRTHVVGPYCHVLLRFTTGDACGPNMITRNAYLLAKHYLMPRYPAEAGAPPEEFALETNMGGDKKPSFLYFQEGRGKTVLAEATLAEGVLRRLLRTSSRRMMRLGLAGMHGTIASGMQSMAFTPASAVAALFAATGQDLGMVGTSSMAHATAERVEGGLHVSIRFPGLEVGTVGGGTGLPHQRAFLEMMGCTGPGSVYRLAQIVAATALALEVSAAAAMSMADSEGFAQAHTERGGLRGRREVEDGRSDRPKEVGAR